MLSDNWGCNFFLQRASISAFGLDFNKETLFGYLFADVHCLFKKREKKLYVNRVSANHYLNLPHCSMKCLGGTSVKRFPTS